VSTTTPRIWYGDGVADDSDLRLCGDVTGKRVVELGVAPPGTNAVEFAVQGAKSIVVDPSAEQIAGVRRAAETAEVHVECHVGDFAELGFATSGSVDLVVSSHRLAEADDLARLLRQVHRVLRPEAPFVVAVSHPAAAMLSTDGQQVERGYGEGAFAVGRLFTALLRADLRIDVVHELRTTPTSPVPSTLVVRARKLGV
jgi:SAM-dependent methyltransferase